MSFVINLSKKKGESAEEEITAEEGLEETSADEENEEYIALEQRVKKLTADGVSVERAIRQVVEEDLSQYRLAWEDNWCR